MVTCLQSGKQSYCIPPYHLLTLTNSQFYIKFATCKEDTKISTRVLEIFSFLPPMSQDTLCQDLHSSTFLSSKTTTTSLHNVFVLQNILSFALNHKLLSFFTVNADAKYSFRTLLFSQGSTHNYHTDP